MSDAAGSPSSRPGRRPAGVRPLVTTALAVVLMAGLAGCGAASDQAGAPASTGSATGGAAPVNNGVSQVTVSLTGDGADRCNLDHPEAAAGPVTFTVNNVSATGITEVELQNDLKILGEKENLAPGLPPSTFTVTLDGGSYSIYCPGAEPETQEFTVTGAAPDAPQGGTADLLNQGTEDYAAWVVSQAEELQTASATLNKAVGSGDVEAAKDAYVRARPFYEKIESDVEGFVLPGFDPTDNKGNLDYLIDMRQSSLDDKVGWSGFHAVERDLWKNGKITADTKKYAADLEQNIAKLVEVVKELKYKPEDLANGAASLLEEVQSNKITGEEEAFSHIDLADFSGNIEGAKQAFANLQPGLEKIDPALAEEVATEFGNVDKALNAYRDPKAAGGFLEWTPQNRQKHSKKLSQTVLGLQQPLQKIAEKVATAR